MASALSLPTPDSFPAFPYDPPYPIQVDLMKHVYAAIEKRQVAIVESPTGTGKTLSLLCATLTWLLDEKQRTKKGKLDSVRTVDGTPDWVVQQTRQLLAREIEAEEQATQERLLNARKREEAMLRMSQARVRKRPRMSEPTQHADALDEDAFLPVEDIEAEDNISPSVRALMNKLEGGSNRKRWDETSDIPHTTKIYYASRTHSQLTQVIPELKRLKLQPVVSIVGAPTLNSYGKRRADEDAEMTQATMLPSAVALGSRKQLCINEDLRRSRGDLDDKCRDLLDEKGSKRCPHLPPPDEDAKMIQFRDQVLATPKDIEELAHAGVLAGTCPYFGSRQAIPQAELVTLPYNLLLHRGSRDALGIDLRDQIVVIDEAHNLISTLLSVTSVRITSKSLATALAQVCHYVAKFRTRLLAYHMLHLKRLVTFMKSLKEYIAEWGSAPSTSKAKMRSESMTSADLLSRIGKNVAGFNFLEIEAYLKKSKIAKKISKYADASENTDDKRIHGSNLPPLQNVEALIVALVAANDDGCVTLSSSPEGVEIKYQPLNPAPPFMEVVEASRAVILAGGTMSPMSDVIAQLFYDVDPGRLSTFSCGHIMPSANLLAVAIGNGPSGVELDFRAEQQQKEQVITDLGHILVNLCRMLPAGTAVFFPSYNFLARARVSWEKNGIMTRLSHKKQIFFEPDDSTQVESTLKEYGCAARSKDLSTNGALLFAVIGAKLSEGLNFSDDLARAVIIIGLPFPNLGSSELQERMKFVRRKLSNVPGKEGAKGKDPGAELYENICMNSVNQSIGRAIRHRNDWAALIFLDRRYKNVSIKSKLPRWIQPHYHTAETFGQSVKLLSTFYQSHR